MSLIEWIVWWFLHLIHWLFCSCSLLSSISFNQMDLIWWELDEEKRTLMPIHQQLHQHSMNWLNVFNHFMNWVDESWLSSWPLQRKHSFTFNSSSHQQTNQIQLVGVFDWLVDEIEHEWTFTITVIISLIHPLPSINQINWIWVDWWMGSEMNEWTLLAQCCLFLSSHSFNSMDWI